MFRISYAILLFSSIVLAILVTFSLAPARAAPELAQAYVAINPAASLPGFLFDDDKGETLDLKSFHGRYVLLNLWATWCAPCVRELPSLDTLASELDDQRIAVIALNENSNGIVATKGFYQRHDMHHLKTFVDAVGRAPALLNLRGLPTTLLIDPNGHEIGRIEGDVNWATEDSVAFLKSRLR